MKIKYLFLALIAMFGFSGCHENYKKVPFSVEVDFSKKGTVYETDFMAPWNMWGSEVYFSLIINYFDALGYTNTRLNEEQWELKGSINHGLRNGIPIPKEEQQYFKLKVTLTPLGWESDNIEIKTIDYSKEAWIKDDYKWFYEKNNQIIKEFKNSEKIEFIVSIPLYGGKEPNQGDKTIMIADLQRLRNYHIRVESLEDVELPKDVKTKFDINRYSTKH